MEVIYSDMRLADNYSKKSIFLAGPTPRSEFVNSWRPLALTILTQLKYEGIVFVPERRSWKNFSPLEQVEWEDKALSMATTILFWVPREMSTMPALTTNVEFGRWTAKRPYAVVYGRPSGAPHTGYLDWLYYKEIGKNPTDNMLDTLKSALT